MGGFHGVKALGFREGRRRHGPVGLTRARNCDGMGGGMRTALFFLVAAGWLVGALGLVHGQDGATAMATVGGGQVTAITVTAPGSGYVTEPRVTVVGGGGQGAAARAVLEADRIGRIEVIQGGNGYVGVPEVGVEAPDAMLESLPMEVALVPKLSVRGERGTPARVEWSETLSGPWKAWTNVVMGVEGHVLVDLDAGPRSRFYRALKLVPSGGPEGFVWIAPGRFQMGSPTTEEGRFFDETPHEVVVTRGFWMSDHEVTQAEYEAVMGVNPSFFKGASLPVERVNWAEAVEYCRRRTELDRATGRVGLQQAYRLPTEAEWEYAARAGTSSARHGDLDAVAWWSGNAGGQTRPVRQKSPNAWGLHDMIGNVWEWCADGDGAYPPGVLVDPVGPTSGPTRVVRGGCWGCGAPYARSAFRNGSAPTQRNSNLGFRAVLSGVR